MSDEASGALSGAASGAAAGAAFGPIGVAAGAVIGGVIGLFSGKKKKAAKKAAKQAAAYRRMSQSLQNAIMRRDIVRQGRIQRAQAVAAGSSDGAISSAVEGAGSSIQSQLNAALTINDRQIGLDNLFQVEATKAGKYASQSAELGSIINSMGSLAQGGATVYGAFKKPSTGPTSSFNNTAAYTNLGNTQAFQTFGNSLNLSK